MKKSFSEILEQSFFTFRKSFWSVFAIYGGLLLMLILVGIFTAFTMGHEGAMALAAAARNNSPEVLSSFMVAHPSFLFTFMGLSILFGLISLIASFWVVLIVRNNTLIGKSLLKEAFKETFGKILKVLALTILICFVGGVFFVLLGFLLKKFSIIFFLLLPFFLMPMSFTVYYGILCQKGNFWELIADGFMLGLHNWFRIFGYFIVFFVFSVLFIIMQMIAIYVLSRMNAIIVGQILNMILQFVLSLIIVCLGTVFYLDLAGIEKMPTEETQISTEVQTPGPQNITK